MMASEVDTVEPGAGVSVCGVNELIVEILTKCGCAGYAKCFLGINKEEFRRMSVEDINNKIKIGSLASSETHQDILTLMRVHAERIRQEIVSFTNIQNQNSLLPTPSLDNNSSPQIQSVSSEAEATVGSSSNGNINNSDSDDDDSDDDDDYKSSIFITAAPKPKQIEEVDLLLTSDEEEEGNPRATAESLTPPVPHSVPQVPQVSNGRPKRAAAIAAASKYKDEIFSDDFDVVDHEGDEDETEEPQRKRRLYSDGCSDMDWDSGTGSGNTFISIIDPSTHLKKLERDGRDYAEEVCTKIRIIKSGRRSSFHNCRNDPEPSKVQEWMEFFKKFGPTITSIELNSWSWKPAKSNCPYNLLKILTKFCPNLEDLIFKVGLEPEDRGVESESDERTSPRNKQKTVDLKSVTFPKLKKIVVDVKEREAETCGKIPPSVLPSILKASPNLQVFRYKFASKRDLDVILETLVDFEACRVDKLRCLEIRSIKEDAYLAANEITKLTSIKAKNLQELILGNGLWEDVEGSLMEKLFKNFPVLKKLVIYGNYQGNSLKKPDIIIEIPPSEHLAYLEIGGNYEFASVIETEQNRNGNVYGQSEEDLQNSLNVLTVDEDLKTELFSVTLKFRHLPNLHKIILGNLFKIDDLHFGRIPKISSFRVGSPWHLSVIYPPETSRKNSYPLVKELQIPDCLKDELFIQNLPKLFPSLEKCWVFLPSVKVLRSFFKCMANSQVKTLFLKTQFDFESTMETCLLGRPARDSEGSLRCWRDRQKLEKLMRYGMWEKWVGFYNVELPCVKREELEELEEEGAYAGLSALKSLEYFEMEHVPRVLRIPKGKEYWLGPRAQFSSETIGFKEYPLSRRCIEQLPSGARQWEWPNFQVWTTDTMNLEAGGFQSMHRSESNRVSLPAGSAQGSLSRSLERGRSSALKVTIGPAMLQANFKFVAKSENKEDRK